MNTCPIKIAVLTLSLMCATGAMAQAMSASGYKAAQDKIGADYKSGRATCTTLAGNAADICVAEARGKEKVAKADLEASYKPSRKAHYDALVAKAEASHEVAKERCDDLAGNAKDVCVKEANAAETSAKADAKAQMKMAEATAAGNEKAAEAQSDAKGKASDARKDASADKRDAQYSVDKEKCAAMAGMAKDQCMDQAKMRAGK